MKKVVITYGLLGQYFQRRDFNTVLTNELKDINPSEVDGLYKYSGRIILEHTKSRKTLEKPTIRQMS
jgi:hypothetical protein